jgi:hypothetical protein
MCFIKITLDPPWILPDGCAKITLEWNFHRCHKPPHHINLNLQPPLKIQKKWPQHNFHPHPQNQARRLL